jgi:hypothetical protein
VCGSTVTGFEYAYNKFARYVNNYWQSHVYRCTHEFMQEPAPNEIFQSTYEVHPLSASRRSQIG